MESNRPEEYINSPYLLREATTSAGDIVEEVWEAVVAREAIIDMLAEGGSMMVDEIRQSGYYEASKRVRQLQDAYGIEPYPETDE